MTQQKLNESNVSTAPLPIPARRKGQALRNGWKLLPLAILGLSA